jgi:hypothetical protein
MIARFALLYRVTTDEPIGVKPPERYRKKPNLTIQKRMRKIEELPPAQQRVILQTIDTFIKGVEAKK